MTLQECIEWQRVNAHHIDRLAHQGDREANKLISVYRELYRHQLDVKLQNEFIVCCNEYAKRDLTITERDILADRFGHKVEE